MILTNFQTVRKDIQKNVKYMADGDKIDYSLNFTAQELDNTHKLYLLFYAFRKALACKRKGYNYVTTLSVQSLVLDGELRETQTTDYFSKHRRSDCAVRELTAR